MPHDFSFHTRSTRFTLQLLVVVAFLLSTANVFASNDSYLPVACALYAENHLEPWWVDQYLCGEDNPEVQNDCKGPPGTCLYPIFKTNAPGACTFFMGCVVTGLVSGKKVGAAYVAQCPLALEEFSATTRQCVTKGEPGTCSATGDYSSKHNNVSIAERENHSEPAPLITLEQQFEMSNPEVVAGCKGHNACRFPSPGDPSSYIHCAPILSGMGWIKKCLLGQIYNVDSRECAASDPESEQKSSEDLIARDSTPLAAFCDRRAANCKVFESCRFPDPREWFSYIQCTPGQSGMGEVKHCPPRQMFSTGMHACVNIPDRSGKLSSHNREPVLLEERTETLFEVYLEGSKQEWDQLQPGSYYTTNDFEATGCKGPQDCVYNFRQDPFSYVKCTPNEDGKSVTAHRLWCTKKGERFSITKRMCMPDGSSGTPSNEDYLFHYANEMYCSLDATRKAGCQIPTNCTYTPYEPENNCYDYVQCGENPDGYERTGKADLQHCSGSESLEFSNVTRKCEPAGAPGTCSEGKKGHYLHSLQKHRDLFELDKKLADKEFINEVICGREITRKFGCQEPTNCSFPFCPDHGSRNHSYITCLDDRRYTLTPCIGGRQFSNITKQCETAGAPGTCNGSNLDLTQLIARAAALILENATLTFINQTISNDFKCCEQAANGTCISAREGFYANPTDCHSYIKCKENSTAVSSMEGLPQLKYCPSNMEWNARTGHCDWPGAPGTCSGRTEMTAYGISCPSLPISPEELLTAVHNHNINDPGTYMYSVPGVCNAFVYCWPVLHDLSKKGLHFCEPGSYFNPKSWALGCIRPGEQPKDPNPSTCETPRDFQCPRKITASQDCEKATYGSRCKSSKGPEWYIACHTEDADGKRLPVANQTVWELRCPFNSVFDLESGGKCKFPNAPDDYSLETFDGLEEERYAQKLAYYGKVPEP